MDRIALGESSLEAVGFAFIYLALSSAQAGLSSYFDIVKVAVLTGLGIGILYLKKVVFDVLRKG